MSEQETFSEHGTEFMPGDKVRVVKGDDKGPMEWTVVQYQRNDAFRCREPNHNTTQDFYANQLEKVGSGKHKTYDGVFDEMHNK